MLMQAIEEDYSKSEANLNEAKNKPNPDIQLGSKPLVLPRPCPAFTNPGSQGQTALHCNNQWLSLAQNDA